MKNKKILIGVLVAILAIAITGGYYFPQISQKLGTRSTATTFLPSLGVEKLDVGTGCGDGFTSCTQGFSVSGATTTILASYDGFIAWDDFAMTSTTTVQALYTNNYGPMICNGSQAHIYVATSSTASFTPSLIFSLGTSTSATSGAGINVIASSTVATSSGMNLLGASSAYESFVLKNGESIIGLMDDNTSNASTTYWSLIQAEFSVPCYLIGQ